MAQGRPTPQFSCRSRCPRPSARLQDIFFLWVVEMPPGFRISGKNGVIVNGLCARAYVLCE
eukprot:11201392-Lingulodinium_polyedra.AAC.1